MSNTRYIEFDSTYRNRNIWPLPGEFEVLISQTGRKGHLQAVDPVSEAANITRWISNNFNASANTSIITTTVTAIVPGIGGAGDNNTVIELTAPAGNFQIIENYYVGAVAKDVSPPNIGASRILSYKYLGNNRAQITVSGMNSVAAGDNILIHDPTDLSDPSNPLFFVPNGRIGDNSYPNYILYNETLSIVNKTPVYRNITSYDTTTHILQVNTSGTSTFTTGLITTWANNHVYSIRKSLPLVEKLNNNTTSSNVCSLPLTFPAEQNYFCNSWIRITSGTSVGEVRRIVRYETFNGNVVAVTGVNVTLPNGASKIPNYYVGAYIQALGSVREVIAYDHNNKVVTLNAAIPSLDPGDPFAFRSIFTYSNFTSNILNNDFEILYFSYDNLNPFIYTGSQVSQQEMVCYEIELLNLSLPNKTLNVGVGSRITFYPYVYVEIANVSGSSAGIKNTIYSNNPNSSRMIFRVTIDDVPNPIISSFVKVDGDGMVQTLKFKPNDNLRFSVHLPNGQIYETVDIEHTAPNPPNPEIQISALFSIKRL